MVVPVVNFQIACPLGGARRRPGVPNGTETGTEGGTGTPGYSKPPSGARLPPCQPTGLQVHGRTLNAATALTTRLQPMMVPCRPGWWPGWLAVGSWGHPKFRLEHLPAAQWRRPNTQRVTPPLFQSADCSVYGAHWIHIEGWLWGEKAEQAGQARSCRAARFVDPGHTVRRAAWVQSLTSVGGAGR